MEQNSSTDLVLISSGKQSRYAGNIPLLRPYRYKFVLNVYLAMWMGSICHRLDCGGITIAHLKR